jgi:hypothetical protein
VRLVDYAVDAKAAILSSDVVLPHDHPRIAIHLARRDTLKRIHAPSIAGHLPSLRSPQEAAR